MLTHDGLVFRLNYLFFGLFFKLTFLFLQNNLASLAGSYNRDG